MFSFLAAMLDSESRLSSGNHAVSRVCVRQRLLQNSLLFPVETGCSHRTRVQQQRPRGRVLDTATTGHAEAPSAGAGAA